MDFAPRSKIMFVITKGNFGGAQKYVYELATRLSRKRFEPVVVCGQGEELPKRLTENGIQSISLAMLGRDVRSMDDIRAFFTLITLFKKERPHIVHLNSSKIGALGALAARIARVPRIIFTIHGFPHTEARPGYQKILIQCITWFSILLSHKTIFITQTEYVSTRNWPLIANKRVLIRNGLTEPMFLERDPARKALAEILNLNPEYFEGKTIVGTIAEYTPNKGLFDGIHAVSLLPELYYILIGEGELRTNLQAHLEKSALKDRVFLTGFIQGASQYLKAFDLFLLPSHKEGLPYVLIEAGLAEIPIVTTSVGGIPELITSGKTGYISKPHDTASLTALITQALHDTKLSKTQSHTLREIVIRDYSFENMLTLTENIYRHT